MSCPGANSLLLSEGSMKLDFSDFAMGCCSLKEGLEDRFSVALESPLATSEVSTLKLGFLICTNERSAIHVLSDSHFPLWGHQDYACSLSLTCLYR